MVGLLLNIMRLRSLILTLDNGFRVASLRNRKQTLPDYRKENRTSSVSVRLTRKVKVKTWKPTTPLLPRIHSILPRSRDAPNPKTGTKTLWILSGANHPRMVELPLRSTLCRREIRMDVPGLMYLLCLETKLLAR
uniref:Uncharacterized protein n=1 Tax=Cacopsylla melanoneura TaxID=428564 RepID=A0A8D9F6B2_9HEMI